jgi:hypothetical protein
MAEAVPVSAWEGVMAFVLLVLGALVVAAAVIDLRAHRRGRRIRIDGKDVRDGRRTNLTNFDKHKPGGMDATGQAGWDGGFGG